MRSDDKKLITKAATAFVFGWSVSVALNAVAHVPIKIFRYMFMSLTLFACPFEIALSALTLGVEGVDSFWFYQLCHAVNGLVYLVLWIAWKHSKCNVTVRHISIAIISVYASIALAASIAAAIFGGLDLIYFPE